MSQWKRIEILPPDAAVFQLCDGGEGVWWAATSHGLLRGDENDWQFVPGMTGFPVWALHARGKRLVASGPTGLVYSIDTGRHWHAAVVEQTQATITCLAASPDLPADGVLLAGTDGDGLLRSHDGGRRWELCNFGLRSFHVTTLAAAPRWGRKEPLLAGTDSGIYASPNAGRAWLPAGLDGQAVQAVAYLSNLVAFAAPEAGGLMRSLDGGGEWHPLRLPGEDPVSVLLPLQSGELLAASGTVLLRSDNSGDSWEPLSEAPDDIFALASLSLSQILIGCAQAGLFIYINQ